MLGACLSSWGLPLISTPCPIPEQRRSCAPRTIPTLFLSGVFSEIKTQGKSPHVGAGNSSDRATSRSGAPVSSLGQAPHPSHPPHTHTHRPKNCGVPGLPRAARSPPGRPRQAPPPRVTSDPLGHEREREANSPGRSRARGRGGAAALQRKPTNFRRRPAGIAWWPG